MPEVLHNPATDIIRQLRLHKPLMIPNIAAQGTSSDLGPRHRKLRTTRSSDDLWDVVRIIEQDPPRISDGVLWSAPFAWWIPKVSNLIGTAGKVVAAKIGITVPLDEVSLQHPDSLYVVMFRKLSMPGPGITVAVTMEEHDSRREVVVVVDYILQVDVAFSPFASVEM